jgi:glycosyltransferase involved in cell wall biosynthesis
VTFLSVAYPQFPVTRDSAGGAEQILWLLERGIRHAGHASVVIAAEGSSISGELIETPRANCEITDQVRRAAQQRHRDAIEAVLRSRPIDLVHFHSLDFTEYLPADGPPRLTTLHLPIDHYPEHIFEIPNIAFNLVSRLQAASLPAANGLPVIPNGVDVNRYRSAQRENFAFVLSRICPEKGIHIALQIAHRMNLHLVVAGPIHPYAAHRAYFVEHIQPLLDNRRQYIGPIGFEAKLDLLSRAKCLLIPSLVAETSSLVAMEAAASGCPVVAWQSGALPEVVKHGVTGFVVNSEEQMAGAVAHVHEISPENCRSIAETHFDSNHMVDDYLHLYNRLSAPSFSHVAPCENLTERGSTRKS